jgi:hypothetical protein
MRVKLTTVSAALLVTAALTTGCTTISPDLLSGSVLWQGGHSRVQVAFNDADRRQIHDYYSRGSSHKRLPPGLAKKKHLPPGHQKQLARNGKLPPGLARRALPNDLERHLSRLPESYARVKVGGDVVLMDTRTQVVVDILYDVAAASYSSADD